MVTLRANEITLQEVSELLGFRAMYGGRFEDFLKLQPLRPEAQQGLDQIVGNFMVYLEAGKISEGQARQISINPILELAGYHKAPIELRIEEDRQFKSEVQPILTYQKRIPPMGSDSQVTFAVDD